MRSAERAAARPCSRAALGVPYRSSELGQPALADAAGRDLRPQVAEHLHRLARVLLDEPEQRRVLDAGVVELRAAGIRSPSW